MIKKDKKFSLKSTIVYPVLVMLAFFVILTAKLNFANNDLWYVLVLNASSEALKVVRLDINTSLLKVLIEKETFLLIDYLGLFVVSILSLISFAIVLFRIFILNVIRIKFFEKEITYIFGLSEDSKIYIKNLNADATFENKKSNHKKQTVVILKKSSFNNYTDERLFLSEQNVKYKICDLNNKQHFFKIISKLSKHLDKKKYNFISFYQDDKEIYDFIAYVQEYLKVYNLYKNNNIQFIISTDSNQKKFVNELISGNSNDLVINSKNEIVTLKDESRGKIRSFNKYDMISYDFLWKNNLAKFFPKDLINSDCTIDEGININLFVLGFGKINQAMLRDILINTQFVRKKELSDGLYKISPLRLNVHIYDENKKMLNWEFANGFMKYRKNKYEDNLDEYLDLPEDYFSHISLHFSKHTSEEYFISSIYDEIKKQSLLKETKQVVNYFLVSLGSDFDNSFIAQQILDSLIEVKKSHNTMFVRTRDGLSLPNASDNDIICFGNDKEILSYDNIVADRIYLSAKIESCNYADKKFTDENIAKEWMSLSKIQQQSNLYSVASIPFKLSLLKFNHFDWTPEEFEEKYKPEDRRTKCVETHNAMISGTKELHPVDVLAFSEHERWNAFEISQGVLPMKKSLFRQLGKGKNANETYHINICTAKGLLEFKDLQDDNNKVIGYEVIQYDYDLIKELVTHMENLNLKTDYVMHSKDSIDPMSDEDGCDLLYNWLCESVCETLNKADTDSNYIVTESEKKENSFNVKIVKQKENIDIQSITILCKITDIYTLIRCEFIINDKKQEFKKLNDLVEEVKKQLGMKKI